LWNLLLPSLLLPPPSLLLPPPSLLLLKQLLLHTSLRQFKPARLHQPAAVREELFSGGTPVALASSSVMVTATTARISSAITLVSQMEMLSRQVRLLSLINSSMKVNKSSELRT